MTLFAREIPCSCTCYLRLKALKFQSGSAFLSNCIELCKINVSHNVCVMCMNVTFLFANFLRIKCYVHKCIH